MSGDTFKINMVFDDPIDNPQIRQDGVMDSIEYNEVYNPIIGYYGNVRIDNLGQPKKHNGFDYSAKIGSAVKAVHAGVVTKVRIGRYGVGKTCGLRKWIVENNNQQPKENTLVNGGYTLSDDLKYSSQKDVCKQCKNKEHCLGLQLWLRISDKNNMYAYYAHLSGFDNKIWSIIKNQIDDKIFDYDIGFDVNKGAKLGYSGCTGNACSMKPYQEHLHFEFRTASAELGTDKNPNSIVKTKFYLDIKMFELDQNRIDIEKVKKLYNNKAITVDERNSIFKHIDNKKHLYIVKN